MKRNTELQQKAIFKVFRIMSKFEGKTGLPYPSKFLTNLKFLEFTFLSQVLFFLTILLQLLYIFMETKQFTSSFI